MNTFSELHDRDFKELVTEILEQTKKFTDIDFENNTVGSYDSDPTGERMFKRYTLMVLDHHHVPELIQGVKSGEIKGKVRFEESGPYEFVYERENYPDVFEKEKETEDEYYSSGIVQIYVYELEETKKEIDNW